MIRSIFGTFCIVLGTILSNNTDHSILSPIVFSVGILLVISLNLGLITRSIPSGNSIQSCCITCLTNITIAIILGLLLSGSGNYPNQLNATISGGIATGIIIGLVSVVNIRKSDYTILITMILMFSFVYLKLPHCVVYAFYFGALPQITLVEFITLMKVICGNIIGGLIVRYSLVILDKQIEKTLVNLRLVKYPPRY